MRTGASDASVAESSGAATLAIPIEAPRGTGGFSPTLALRYSSQGEDGPFGVGWSLQLGEIRRATRFGTPSYTAADRFELDGELLVASFAEPGRYFTQTESFRRILLTANGWEVTFPNGNKARFGWNQETRILHDTGGIFRWLLTELEDVNGNVIVFRYERALDPGTAYPKAIEYTYRSGVQQGPLRRIEFVLGERDDQRITYAGGVLARMTQRVVEIRSTVGGTAFRRLRLHYDEDPASTGRSRLTSSQLFGDTCAVTVPDPEASCTDRMPQQTYAYTDLADVVPAGTSTHWVSHSGTTPVPFDVYNDALGPRDGGVRIGDVDGDGWQDLLYAREGYPAKVYRGSPSGWVEDAAWSNALSGLSYARTRPRVVSLVGDTPYIDCYATQADTRLVAFARGPGNALTPKEMDEAQLADVNGDGRVDILISIDYGPCQSWSPNVTATTVHPTRRVWLNTGSGWSPHAGLSQLPAAFRMVSYSKNGACEDVYGVTSGPCAYRSYLYPLGTSLVDLNGDGRLDLVAASRGPYYGPASSVANVNKAWINTGDAWQEVPQYALPALDATGKRLASTVTFENATWPTNGEWQSGDTGLRFADLNGDGLTDILKEQVGTSGILVPANSALSFAAAGVWLNTGSGWCFDGDPGSPCAAASRYRLPAGEKFARKRDFGNEVAVVDASLVLADLNGDGVLDLLRADGYANAFDAWLHDPAAVPVWQPAPEFEPPSSMPLVRRDRENGPDPMISSGVRLFDVDANGTADLVKNYDGADVAQFRSRATLGDRLARHENGKGAAWEFAYETAPQQRQSGMESTAATNLTETGEASAGISRWFQVPVVTDMRVTTGSEHYDYAFAYAAPRWCEALRSGLGFRLVDKVQPDDSLARVFFYQAHGRAGRASRRSIFVGGQRRWGGEYTWAALLAHDAPETAGPVYGGRLTRSIERNFYGTAPDLGAVQQVDYVYDDTYGFDFVSRMEIRRPTGDLDVVRTPVPLDPVRWIAGLVDVETRQIGGVVHGRIDYGYDAFGRLTSEDRDVRARTAGAPTTGHVTTSWTYDAYGNVKSRTDPGGRVERFCHDGDAIAEGVNCPTAGSGAHAVLAAVQDKLGAWTEVDSDPATGNVRGVVRFNGDAVTIGLDAFARPRTSTIQPDGDPTAYVLEARTYADAPAGPSNLPFVETVQYAQAGLVGGVRTATYLDGLGRPVRAVQPSRNGWVGVAYRHDFAGRLLRETLPVDCDADPNCLAATADDPPARALAYDALGRPLTETTPLGVRAFGYGREVRANVGYDGVFVKEPRGSLVLRLLDGDRTAAVEECDNTVSPAATTPGTSCSSPDVTSYVYEPTGELRATRDALGFELAYTFDTLGRATAIADPNAGTTLLSYYSTGTVHTSQNGRGQLTTYTYDALDRPTYVQKPGTEPAVTIEYDPQTRAPWRIREGSLSAPIQTIELEYDGLGREERRSQTVAGVTLTADFRYDLLDRIEEITYPNGWSAVYFYAGAFFDRVCGKAPGASDCDLTHHFVTGTTYDDLGRVTRTTTPAGLVDRTYDPATHVPSSLRVSAHNSGATLLHLAYAAYDEAGHVTRIDDLRPGAATDAVNASATYTYHPHREFLASHDLGANLGAAAKYFRYDEVGNLVGRDLASPTAPPNQVRDPARPNRLLSYTRGSTTTSLAYDGDGNVVQRGGQHFGFDSASRLTCVGTGSTEASGLCATARYRYDPTGDERTWEWSAAGERLSLGQLFEWHKGTSASTLHVLVGGRRVATVERASDTLVTGWVPPFWEPPVPWRVLGLGAAGVLLLALLAFAWRLGVPQEALRRPVPVALSLGLSLLLIPGQYAFAAPPPPSGVVKRWFVEDHVGSATLVLDELGNVVERRVFEPFGKVFEATDPLVTSPRFTGKRYSADAALYDFGARWYDPELGRFAQIDPIVQSLLRPITLNAYAYAGNDPVNNIDPDGRGILTGLLTFFSVALTFVMPAVANAIGEALPAVVAAAAGGPAYHAATWAGIEVSAHYEGERSAQPAAQAQAEQHTCHGGDACPGPDPRAPARPPNAQTASQPTPIELIEANGIRVASLAGRDNPNLVTGVGPLLFPGVPVLGGASRLLNPGINITQKGLSHVLKLHTGTRALRLGKSMFNAGEDIVGLIRSATQQPMVRQPNGNFARTFNVGRNIGLDRVTGSQTSMMTVITNRAGDLVTAFPGLP